MHASLRKELGARHSLLNLSVHDLVEEFARHSVYAVFEYLASSSNLSITTRCRASSLIYTKQAYLYADKYSKKHLKVRKADALKQAELDSLLDSDDYCLDSSLDIDSEDNLEDKEATTAKNLSLCESRDGNRTLHSGRLIGAYILYFKELLSNNSRIFASVIGMTRTRAIVLSAIIGHVYFKN
ncbi:hypothetical protein HBI18_252280 [Parastagonospora nodorum]|nr:hypothetical protein HBI18_252280 [Parastagonospora nodorum]